MARHQIRPSAGERFQRADELGPDQAKLQELRVQIEELLRPRSFVRRTPDPKDGTLSDRDAAIVGKLKRILKFRDLRASIFNQDDLFADPAWDMLLEIFVADLMQQKMPVSSACLGGRVPATTGLRWLKVLERCGFIYRSADPHDRRRVFVSLTPDAFTKMRLLVETKEFQVI